MTDARPGELPAAGSIMSEISLPSAADRLPTTLISGRGPTVVVVLPVGVADGVDGYLEALVAESEELATWGVQLVVVVSGSAPEAEALVPAALAQDHTVLTDPRRKLANGPAALVVDEWREVFFARQVERVDLLPTPTELREWAVFVAIQCPECEGREGAWRDLDVEA